MFDYRLVLEPDDNGTILVTSPDFPLVTYGVDRASALTNAVDAIETLLQSMMDRRDEIPAAGKAGTDTVVVSLRLQTQLKVALHVAMRAADMTRADLQRALRWKRESVDRLFRLDHASRLDQIDQAFTVLGKKVSPVVRTAAVEEVLGAA